MHLFKANFIDLYCNYYRYTYLKNVALFLFILFYRWYHGRLDRYSAELRLQATNKLGSYLIRESDRKPGSYVLSYLGHTGINHFR